MGELPSCVTGFGEPPVLPLPLPLPPVESPPVPPDRESCGAEPPFEGPPVEESPVEPPVEPPPVEVCPP
ncbi:type VII secretion-associated serine protease, partial [Streptomyces noursei]